METNKRSAGMKARAGLFEKNLKKNYFLSPITNLHNIPIGEDHKYALRTKSPRANEGINKDIGQSDPKHSRNPAQGRNTNPKGGKTPTEDHSRRRRTWEWEELKRVINHNLPAQKKSNKEREP